MRWLCIGATLVGLFFLASLLLTLLWRGLEALDWTVLTREFEPTTYGDDTLPKGGLSHAIVGTLIQTALGHPASARRSACWSAPTSPSTRAARRSATRCASCPTCCCRPRPS